MKSNKLKAITYTAITLTITGSIIFPQIINANRPIDQKVEQKNEQNNKPNPVGLIYKANSHADKSKFISKEEIIKKPRMEKDGKLKSADLVTYEQFSREVLGQENPGTIIENDRMVWVLTVEFPNGIKTKGGKFSKAVQISAFDSETGQLLTVTTIGEEDTTK
ncbi:hypothetical protein RB620_28670 [Paenibacillus sp. LHD-117]|uniref:hypothetical protein n=1 Tax=Paenibacillus sp. LHD-117 TaxID=3071412 RepID=UPI0027E17960|nr:hypothetical protein [Paenibacillus sp. LHD-117]MDQ6423395.1 hypothetical protein [Paenibacillus sp. LHD-117]